MPVGPNDIEITDSWVAHWNARRAMKWEELGAVTGA